MSPAGFRSISPEAYSSAGASGAVTQADLEAMEQRLQARFLDALREALAEREDAQN